MHRTSILVLLTVLGSGLCWWPAFVEPTLDLPFWVSLACAALCTALSMSLAPAKWPFLLLASGLSTVAGICVGAAIWPGDPLAAGFVPYYVAANTLAVIFVGFSAGLMMRRRFILNAVLRRVAWAAILACAAFGPVTLALTPAVVRHRLARNDRLAAERFASLKKAVKSTAEADGNSKICDGTVLRRHYDGPSFSATDWRRITGNYVKQDGYIFMVYCHEKAGFTIDAHPARALGDGTRWFCAEGAGKVGCRMDFRHNCLPCPK